VCASIFDFIRFTKLIILCS